MTDNLIERDEAVVDNTDYVEAIKNLKENSVSKEKYEALEAEKKKLLEAMINGDSLDTQDPEQLDSRLEYYKKYKENKFATDLDFWDNFIKLRKATIKEYGGDPCVPGNYGLTPEGAKAQPAYGEVESVNESLDIMEDLVKEADGNPLKFESLLLSSVPRK